MLFGLELRLKWINYQGQSKFSFY